jgi:hypothetical protein
MSIEEDIKLLIRYIDNLSDFKIVNPEIPVPYQHMGATITDAMLQAGTTWKTVVKPRILKLMAEHPEAKTTTGFLDLLRRKNIKTLLQWKDSDKPDRVLKVTNFLHDERIETEADLKIWLENDLNTTRLKKFRGIGNKTTDYFKILSGISTSAIDRHLIDFLKKAGISIDINEYSRAKEIINKAAEQKGIDKSLLDHSIWKYMSEGKNKKRKTTCRRGHYI